MRKTIASLTGAAALALTLPTVAAAQDTTSIKTKSGMINPAPAGKAQIVFFRPGSMMGAALGCTVRNAGGELARLGSGKYYAVTVEPGKQEFFTTGEATDRLTLEVDPDATYYVRCNIGMGVVAGRANLSPSDRATFEARSAKMSSWVPKDK